MSTEDETVQDACSEPPGTSALLLLADGRFPSGGHAHSGGLETAAAQYGVRDVATLEAFLTGRAATAGLVAAAFAAATRIRVGERSQSQVGLSLVELDAELDARIPSRALRAVSRRLGRQLLRAARVVWTHPVLDHLAPPPDAHRPIVLGAVAAAAGLGVDGAALVALHESVVGPATAAIRLLGLDPFAVHAVLARLSPQLDALAAQAVAYAPAPPADLPAYSAPLLDIGAEHHATWEVRLFAS